MSCAHRRKAYRDGDVSTDWWICQDCRYESYKQPKPVNEAEHKDVLSSLFGPKKES